MTPLSLPMTPTHRTIDKRDPTAGKEDPAQGLAIAKEGGGVDSQAHENVSDTVNGHEAVDHLLVRGGTWWLELKESEGILGADDGVDAKSHEDGCDYIGSDAKGGRLGECAGCHFRYVYCFALKAVFKLAIGIQVNNVTPSVYAPCSGGFFSLSWVSLSWKMTGKASYIGLV